MTICTIYTLHKLHCTPKNTQKTPKKKQHAPKKMSKTMCTLAKGLQYPWAVPPPPHLPPKHRTLKKNQFCVESITKNTNKKQYFSINQPATRQNGLWRVFFQGLAQGGSSPLVLASDPPPPRFGQIAVPGRLARVSRENLPMSKALKTL